MIGIRVATAEPILGLRLHTISESTRPDASRSSELLALKSVAATAMAQQQAILICLGELKRAAATMPALVQSNLTTLASQAVEIGITIAREVIGKALQSGLMDPTGCVTRCLQELTDSGQNGALKVRVHHEDLDQIIASMSAIGSPSIEFISDPQLSRGAIVVESQAGRLLYDPREVFERIATSLRAELLVATPNKP